MAITLIQTPSSHMPAYNDQWFTATSNQTAQPNFQFYVTITVHYYNGTIYTTKVSNEAINVPSDSIMRFNAMAYTKKFIKNFLQFHTAGWLQCKNGVLKVIVNVGERYDVASVKTIFPGANTTYYVWNASLEYTGMGVNYDVNNYLSTTGTAFKILNDYPDTRTHIYSQNWLYILCASDATITKARVTSGDGFIFTQFDIVNPFYNTTNWYDRYLCLNVSPSRLATLGGLNWTGIPGTTYTVDLYDAGGIVRYTASYKYSDVCSKFFRYQQIYLNTKGAYDTMFFELVSEKTYDSKKTTVSHTPYYDAGATGLMTYQPTQPTTFTTSVRYNKNIKIRSNWINETQSPLLRDLIFSPSGWLQESQSSATIIYSANPSDSSYKENKHFNGKLFNLEVNLSFASDNFRQSGA